MTTALESTAKEWLTYPTWTKVFKNTFDILKEQTFKGLLAISAIAVAVRFVANIATGEILCVVVGARGNISLTSLAGPFHTSLAAYAAQDPTCLSRVFDSDVHNDKQLVGFSKYGPLLIMLQALMLIGVEKIIAIFPLINQKLERFYKSVVEEALIGRDPDIADDYTGGSVTVEKILRQRQRDEICGAFKQSSEYYAIFVAKNLVQIVIAVVFVVINIGSTKDSDDKPQECDIQLGLGSNNHATMQCQQKRFEFFYASMLMFTILLLIVIMLNILNLLWCLECLEWRKITSVIGTLEKNIDTEKLNQHRGKDFLFLFDLIAHTCGLSATLRVLSYTSDWFKNLCQPIVERESGLRLTETSIEVFWNPAILEAMANRKIRLERYVATIFPNSSHDIIRSQGIYKVKFENLQGGLKEHLVTISAVISDSKMKGYTVKTFLPPFPPQKLKVRGCPTASEIGKGQCLSISWTPPKGEFSKYKLIITLLRKTEKNSALQEIWEGFKKPDEIWLAREDSEYKATNLRPGELYKVELKSISGGQSCLQEKTPWRTYLTQPDPPTNLRTRSAAGENKVEIFWDSPQEEGHTYLAGYQVKLKDPGGAVLSEKETVANLYIFPNLAEATEYTIGVATFCKHVDELRAMKDMLVEKFHSVTSEEVSLSVVTLPPRPTGVTLEKFEPTSIKLKWDPLKLSPKALKVSFAVSISKETDWTTVLEDKIVDTNIYMFSNLPESGEFYRVSVTSVATSSSNKVVRGPTTWGVFPTKPSPPSDLQLVGQMAIAWQRSPSASIKHYKVKVKKDEEKSLDYFTLDQPSAKEVRFIFPVSLAVESEYSINVYSELEAAGEDGVWYESGPLHSRLVYDSTNGNWELVNTRLAGKGGLTRQETAREQPRSSVTYK